MDAHIHLYKYISPFFLLLLFWYIFMNFCCCSSETQALSLWRRSPTGSRRLRCGCHLRRHLRLFRNRLANRFIIMQRPSAPSSGGRAAQIVSSFLFRPLDGVGLFRNFLKRKIWTCLLHECIFPAPAYRPQKLSDSDESKLLSRFKFKFTNIPSPTTKMLLAVIFSR